MYSPETPGPPASDPTLVETPLLPPGFYVPQSRFVHPSVRMRRLLDTEPYLFGPGIFDAFGAQLVMYYGFKAVYFSGYSFAIGHLGTTDMDLYSGPEIADGARRAVSAGERSPRGASRSRRSGPASGRRRDPPRA